MITFQCECGKTLKAKEEAAGKRVRCPGCAKTLVVPARGEKDVGRESVERKTLSVKRKGQETEDAPRSTLHAPPSSRPSSLAPRPTGPPAAGEDGELALREPEEGPAKARGPQFCPRCHVELPPGAVLCTTCGIDLRTGKDVERKRTLAERIPWGVVRRAATTAALLGILVGVVYLLVSLLSRERPAGETPPTKEEKAEGGAPQPQPFLRGGGTPTFVRVQCAARWAEPEPPDEVVFHGEDGDHTAKRLKEVVAAKIAREATDTLWLGGHKVLRKGDGKLPGADEELTLVVQLELGWLFQQSDGRAEPKAPYVASCTARLLRRSGVAFWETQTPYSVERPEAAPRKEAIGHLAALKAVKTDVDYDKYTDQLASAVAKAVFESIPGAAVVGGRLSQERAAERTAQQLLADLDAGKPVGGQAAQLVNQGNAYLISGLSKRVDKIGDPSLLAALAERAPDKEVARRAAELYVAAVGTGPRASEAIKGLAQPEKLFLGPLMAKFAKASGTFAAELPLLDGLAQRMPYVALAFGRTAVRLEENPSVQQAYRKFCAELEAKLEAKKLRADLGEVKVLESVAEAEPATVLGRTAALTALGTGVFGSEKAAAFYLCRVAAKVVPDVVAEPWPDGGLRLSDEQMEMLRGMARRDDAKKVAEVVAIALLMRVGGEQRPELRKLIEAPAYVDPAVDAARSDLESGDPNKIRNAILHGLPHNERSYPVAPLMADAYYTHKDPGLRATALLGLFCSGGQSEPYLWALLHMLEAPDVVERRAASLAFQKLGPKTLPVLGDLRAALPRITDPQARRSLESAIGQALAAAQAFRRLQGGQRK